MKPQIGVKKVCGGCARLVMPLHFRLPEGVDIEVRACPRCDQLIPKWSLFDA